MLPPRMESAQPHDVAAVFGDEFSAGIRNLKVGQWEGSVRCSFGLHLVRVTKQRPARTPPFTEVRDQLAREWNRTRSVEVKNTFYRNLRKRYSVEIERAESWVESAQVVAK
jgi:parvulin-like peptidyl-prolyl isomerase